MKICDLIKKILTYIGTLTVGFVAGLVTIISVSKSKNNEKNKSIKERTDELKETSADDIIAMSPNQSDIQSTVSDEKEQLRKRIRDRFNKNL